MTHKLFSSLMIVLIITACAPATPAPAPTTTPVPATSTATIISTPTLGIGSTLTSDKDGMTLVFVPAGEFTMGSDADDAVAECQKFISDCGWTNVSFTNEEPPHSVHVDAFWIDQTEVTNKMYALCVEAGVCQEPTSTGSETHSNYYGNAEFDNYPVIYVDWNMAKTYCEWVDRRLPTEAEWEKAARGENASVYPWGDTFDGSLVNFCDTNCSVGDWANKSFNDGFADVAPVGSYPTGKSVYGALDMAGNVWEWVSSLDKPYPYDATDGRENLDSSDTRLVRGGSWNAAGNFVRSANRISHLPTFSYRHLGFRCARSPSATSAPPTSTPLPPTATNLPPTLTNTPAPPTATRGIVQTLTGNDGMTLLYVPAGEFTMGSDNGRSDEKPVHTVNLDAFWIDQTEVTNKMYALCVDADVCQEPTSTGFDPRSRYYGNAEFDNYPVIFADWSMAKTYCEWAGRRLPTEAEWEKAARGENASVYPWGDTFDGSLVNFCDTNCPADWANKSFNDGFADVAPVGSYPSGKSVYGALDMAGNVLEWVSSLREPYPYDATDGRENLDSSDSRVLRGGSWLNVADGVRSADRAGGNPSGTTSYLGFRCSRSP